MQVVAAGSRLGSDYEIKPVMDCTNNYSSATRGKKLSDNAYKQMLVLCGNGKKNLIPDLRIKTRTRSLDG